MDDHKKSWGAAEHALTGAGVGAAGAGQSIALIGASAGLALLPLSLVVGAVAGLAWWVIKAVASDSD